MTALFLLVACGSRPGGPPSVNGDADHAWPEYPSVDREIVSIMNRDAVPGLAACLVQDGEVAWCGGYGERDTDAGLPATPETPFLLASASKAVTAVAAMQAVEDGTLDLDADINQVLPFEVTHPDTPSRPITLRHLLSHTAGITDNWDVMDAHYTVGDSPEALGGFLEGYLAVGGADYSAEDNFLHAGVGGVSDYSNIGVALAGYLVEAATGAPFDTFCEDRIFGPLGMKAGWHLADLDESEVALPTRVVDGAFVTVPHYGFPDYPDGQLRADAYSMATFVAAMAEHGALGDERLLTEESVAEMWSASYPDLDPTQGLVWYTWKLDGDAVWGHNGGEVGASTEILVRERDGAGVVVLLNSVGAGSTLEDVELAVLGAVE